jgi:hypothetical protein
MLTSFMEKFVTETRFEAFEKRMEDFVLEMRDFKLETRSNFEALFDVLGHYSKQNEERFQNIERQMVTKEYLDKRLRELRDEMHGMIRTHERIMHA